MVKNKKAKEEARKKLQAEFIDYYEEALDILQEERTGELDEEQADRFSKAVTKMKELVAHGANPNLRYPERAEPFQESLLREAVCAADLPDLAHALLDLGADPRPKINQHVVSDIIDHYYTWEGESSFLPAKPPAHDRWLELLDRLHEKGAGFKNIRETKMGGRYEEGKSRPADMDVEIESMHVRPLQLVRWIQAGESTDYLDQLEEKIRQCTAGRIKGFIERVDSILRGGRSADSPGR